MKYDFIVVGAGLAGSYFSYLASQFASVLLVDKADFDQNLAIFNIFERHNNQFFDKGVLPLDDKDIFPLKHHEIVYSGKQNQGIVDGREFGTEVGRFCNVTALRKYFIKKAEENGAELLFNTKIKNIIYSYEGMSVEINDEDYRCEIVLIATGSSDFKLQQHLGFHTPDLYWGAFTRFRGDESTILNNISNEYIFHYNRKISPHGPLFTTRGTEHFDLGILHKEKEETTKKLLAVIARYDFIRQYFDDVKPAKLDGAIEYDNGINIFVKPVSKGPVKRMARDRAILLGECAGLVTGFFYEGTTGCACSAKVAANLLKDLKESGKSKWYDATDDGIGQFNKKMKTMYLDSYLASQKGSEELFIKSGDVGEDIFNVYAGLLNKNKELRRYVYEALILDNLSNYKLSNDRKSGETIYKALPVSKKILYSPHFLRASFM